MSEIPPAVLQNLHDGREETITLVEWLAIDVRRLARAVGSSDAIVRAGLDTRAAAHLASAADRLAGDGVMARSHGMGEAIHAALDGHRQREHVLSALGAHTSDMVRSWAAYARMADPALDLPARLTVMLPVAADRHMAVRECAWEALRPHLAKDLSAAIATLEPWVRDADANVRRCAVEATRPCGVWTLHLNELKADPSPALPLLEPVRSDPSDYVRRSVGNWLNDASKSRSDWVRTVCVRWERESPTAETAWTVRHALRTLTKPTKAGRRAPRKA